MFNTNEHFRGKVKSIAFQGKDKPATVGVMAAGEDKEKITVISGVLTVKLENDTNENSYMAAHSFEVPANSSFKFSSAPDCVYLCEYG